MIKSMTGFGRAEMIDEEKKIAVEMKSVNHRYLDINMRIPKKLSSFEGAIRGVLKQYMQRGKVDLFITYEDYTQSGVTVKYNREIAQQYLEYSRQIEEEFQLKNDMNVSNIMRFPEVLTMEEEKVDEEELWTSLKQVLVNAVQPFINSRIQEGNHLSKDILEKLDGMYRKVELVEKRSPEILKEYREKLENKTKELLADGTVVRVLGWKAGDLAFNPEPAYFETPESLEDFVYDGFCGANLSKYMIEASKLEGKTMVCLKPCDTYSFNQLLKEHRVDREKAYIVGVGCKGKLDIEKIRKMGIKGIRGISGAEITGDAETLTVDTVYGEKTCAYKDAMLERCHVCKGKEHKIYDELIGESKETKDADRFAEVERIEAMSPEEKFAFWQSELSKCIRCNACRNVCPACSCRKCVFDSNKFDSAQKANVDSFEEKMFHVIRAFHVAGRCTDCGECSRVCPQGIPLHLFNRKFIKDIDAFYGEYQAGEDAESKGPLTSFTFEDVEPGIVAERG